MQVTLKTTAKKHKLTLEGEIGYPETAQLWDAAQQIMQHPKPTQLDWSRLSRIHYAGVQVLFALRKTLEERGYQLQISEPDPILYQQLHTFGVWDALLRS
ncbi:MAG: STAS domain-containing protein [Fimbriimonadales bacterium]|nr:STAS domain-containing protein [Fimbriimonadales bacterium]